VDDGLRAGLLEHDALREVSLYRRASDSVLERYPGLDGRRLVYETVRRMVNHVVSDLIETSGEKIGAAGVESIDAVRAHGEALIGLSEATAAEHIELKQFLRKNLYRHYRVVRMTAKSQHLLTSLFDAFMSDIRLMPDDHRDNAKRMEAQDGDAGRARAVADYVAGMTDRFAISEHARLFEIEVHT
ncbi:MAG: deoxyguanosinetriphosphate triphosphohydrolase, partial [Gammaproteobacteria bacterium]|nr:deoxyguanosinetriphosphate triphosphohydrolase [Gammaproteobacteria bacterium]